MSNETTTVDLAADELAALRSLPVRLSLRGTLTHLSPHAGTIRALEARGLVVRTETEVVRTPAGDAELAYAGGAS